MSGLKKLFNKARAGSGQGSEQFTGIDPHKRTAPTAPRIHSNASATQGQLGPVRSPMARR